MFLISGSRKRKNYARGTDWGLINNITAPVTPVTFTIVLEEIICLLRSHDYPDLVGEKLAT